MICAICSKREAVVFMHRSDAELGGQLALCEDCARARGLSVKPGQIELRLEDILRGMPRSPETNDILCPDCGTSLETIRSETRIGCPGCARTFKSELDRFFRSRGRPHHLQAGAFAFPDPEGIALDLEADLGKALASENYEEAALIRDRLSSSRKTEPGFQPLQASPSPLPSSFVSGFLLPGHALPEAEIGDEVILETRTRVSRNFEGLGFPGKQARMTEDLASLVHFASSLQGFPSFALGDLEAPARGGCVERRFFPRPYALSPENRLAFSTTSPVFGLFGEGDSLRLVALAGGLGALRGMAMLEPILRQFPAWKPFAHDEEFGYLASSLEDCGSGVSFEATVHLPALASLGMAERAMQGLLARGLVVRGFYCSGEASSGDLFLISTDKAFCHPASDLARIFESALEALAIAETRARAELLAKRREELLDRAGRALGLIRYCRLLGEHEARAALSALRLASLSGCLEGSPPSLLGGLMLSMGPDMTALLSGGKSGEGKSDSGNSEGLREAQKGERLRALLLEAELKSGRIKEGG